MSQMPPVDPVLDMPLLDEPPAWPKVIGIISIVVASLGLACGVCGLANIALLPVMENMTKDKLGPMPAIMKPTGLQMALGVVQMGWPALLLGAGIATVRRRYSGRTMHLVYGA